MLAIWNKVLRKWGEPRLEMRRDLESNVPDWKGGASIPAKATRASLWVNRAHNSVNQAMAVSIATMRALEKQIKVLDKTIEQQFQIIPNTLTSVPGIGKVYSAGIIAETGDIHRFNSQASVAKYAGLVFNQVSFLLRFLIERMPFILFYTNFSGLFIFRVKIMRILQNFLDEPAGVCYKRCNELF